MPEPEPFDAGIPSQDELDVQTLRQILAQARGELAMKKIQWHVANKAGLPGTHPGSLAGEIERIERTIAEVERLLQAGEVPGPQGKVLHLPKIDVPASFHPDGA